MRQASETSPGDAIAKFLELLRKCVAVCCRFLFNLIQIILFGWLFVVGILLPWRLIPLIFFSRKNIFSCTTTMSTFRKVAVRLCVGAILDMITIPFALIATLTLTRTDCVIHAIRQSFIPNQEATEVDLLVNYSLKLRTDLIRLGLSAPFDLIGILCGAMCFLLPFPTLIGQFASKIKKEYDENLHTTAEGETNMITARIMNSFSFAFLSCACVLITGVEILLFMVTLPFAIIPTRTKKWCIFITKHIKWRAKPYWCKTNSVDDQAPSNTLASDLLIMAMKGIRDVFFLFVVILPGIFVCAVCFIAPWPTEISKEISSIYKKYKKNTTDEESLELDDNFTENASVKLMVGCLSAGCCIAVRTVFEIPFAFVSILLLVITPTQFKSGTSIFKRHFSYRYKSSPCIDQTITLNELNTLGIDSLYVKKNSLHATTNLSNQTPISDSFMPKQAFAYELVMFIFYTCIEFFLICTFGISGCVASVLCILLPWPNEILITLHNMWKKKDGTIRSNGYDYSISSKRIIKWMNFGLVPTYLFVRTCIEIPLLMIACLFLIIPTRTFRGIGIFKIHINYRRRRSPFCGGNGGKSSSNLQQNNTSDASQKVATEPNLASSTPVELDAPDEPFIFELVLFIIASFLESVIFLTFGLFGVGATIICLIAPWPTDITKQLFNETRRLKNLLAHETSTASKFCHRVVFYLRFSFFSIILLIRTVLEIGLLVFVLPILIVSLPLGLLRGGLSRFGLKTIYTTLKFRIQTSPCFKSNRNLNDAAIITNEEGEKEEGEKEDSSVVFKSMSSITDIYYEGITESSLCVQLFSILVMCSIEICLICTLGLCGLMLTILLLIVPFPTEISSLIMWEINDSKLWILDDVTTHSNDVSSARSLRTKTDPDDDVDENVVRFWGFRLRYYCLHAIYTIFLCIRTCLETPVIIAALFFLLLPTQTIYILNVMKAYLNARIQTSPCFANGSETLTNGADGTEGTEGTDGRTDATEGEVKTNETNRMSSIHSIPSIHSTSTVYIDYSQKSQQLIVQSLGEKNTYTSLTADLIYVIWISCIEISVCLCIALPGMACSLCCFVTPMPTDILRILKLEQMRYTEGFEERRTSNEYENVNDSLLRRLTLQCKCSLYALFLCMRTVVELPLVCLVLMCSLFVPTRTVAAYRVVFDHFWYRYTAFRTLNSSSKEKHSVLSIIWYHRYSIKHVHVPESLSAACLAQLVYLMVDVFTFPFFLVAVLGGGLERRSTIQKISSKIIRDDHDNTTSAEIMRAYGGKKISKPKKILNQKCCTFSNKQESIKYGWTNEIWFNLPNKEEINASVEINELRQQYVFTNSSFSKLNPYNTGSESYFLIENYTFNEQHRKYLSERASIANGSTVVDISIHPPSFKPVSLSLSRFSQSKTPKQVFFNPINIFDSFTHSVTVF